MTTNHPNVTPRKTFARNSSWHDKKDTHKLRKKQNKKKQEHGNSPCTDFDPIAHARSHLSFACHNCLISFNPGGTARSPAFHHLGWPWLGAPPPLMSQRAHHHWVLPWTEMANCCYKNFTKPWQMKKVVVGVVSCSTKTSTRSNSQNSSATSMIFVIFWFHDTDSGGANTDYPSSVKRLCR